MFLDNESRLKEFLIQELLDICDADPSVLADYVLALLKHEKTVDQLKKLCMDQLVDFLGKGD